MRDELAALLAALQDCVDKIADDTYPECRRARAAIAKAEGLVTPTPTRGMSDIVERLRHPLRISLPGDAYPTMLEAAETIEKQAAEIERQRDEITRLRALLEDEQYIQLKADYNTGRSSHHGWLAWREAQHFSHCRDHGPREHQTSTWPGSRGDQNG